MIVYGSPLCIDCRNYLAIQRSRGFAAEFVDITESTANLKRFLTIRDTEPLFADVCAGHSIGIPLFVREDGCMSFDIDEAMGWLGQPPVREDEIAERRETACASC